MIHIFNKEETDFDGQGKIATATKNTTTNIDFLVSTYRLINGGLIYCDKAIVGDYFQCQIIDIDGVYETAGTIINQWMTNWPVIPGEHINIKIEQVGEIPGSLRTLLRVSCCNITVFRLWREHG